MAATQRAAFVAQRPWSEAEFAGLLQNRGCFVTGDATCFALARVVLDEAELLTIATHPHSQRQGLAIACMQAWQNTARERGARQAFLEVAADNIAAIALYQACGFEPCGQRSGYYRRQGGKSVDALMMARQLT